MGIDFKNGPHSTQPISEYEKQLIIDALQQDSHQMVVNLYYNNDGHFQTNLPFYSRYSFNIEQFLREIVTLVNSQHKNDKITIIGGVHTNSHSSGMIYQHNTKTGQLMPLFVEDSYIRFDVMLSDELRKSGKIRLLSPGAIYHFLMHIPCIQQIKIGSTKKYPIYIPEMPEEVFPAIQDKSNKYLYPHNIEFLESLQYNENEYYDDEQQYYQNPNGIVYYNSPYQTIVHATPSIVYYK